MIKPALNALSTSLRSVAALALAMAVFTPNDARACSWAYCGSPAFVLPLEGVTVPEGLSALLWTPLVTGGGAGSDSLVLERLTDGQPGCALDGNEPGCLGEPNEIIPITLEESLIPTRSIWAKAYDLVPDEPLTPGTYRLTTPNTEGGCENEQPPALVPVFEVTGAAELPNALGMLQVDAITDGPLTVAEDASCSTEQEATTVDISLALDASAEPWADLLAFQTLVDGNPWWPADFSGAMYATGSSWMGRAKDRVFALCEDLPYSEHDWLLPGTYTIQIIARLPGMEQIWESDVLTVSLDCNGGTMVIDEDPGEEPQGYCGGNMLTMPSPDACEGIVQKNDGVSAHGGGNSTDSLVGCASTRPDAMLASFAVVLLAALRRRRRKERSR